MKIQVVKYNRVDSTNNVAIRRIRKGKIKPTLIIANSQKKGRGQYGRKWISYKGNLFVSFFYILENLNLSLSKLTKINCLLVKKLISIYYKKKIIYKKPNDLLIYKKKICGILQETVDKFDRKYLIVGIGINLNKSPIIKDYPTTDLYKLLKKKISKKDVEIKLKNIFQKELSRFYNSNK